MKRLIGAVALAALTALAAIGCAGRKNPLLLPNQPPEVELFPQRLEGAGRGPSSYRLQWVGRDPDGVIDHYLVSEGSPADDARAATWTATSSRERMLSFPARAPLAARAEAVRTEPSVFSVVAVDGAGARSEPARVAFFQGALAPIVTIRSPAPSSLVRYDVGPTFCVEWEGTAFGDSTGSARLVEFKYILLGPTTAVSVATARMDPDSVRRYYAPRDWEGWTSVGRNASSATLRDLTPGIEHVFAITCFDDAGNYDPLFSFNKNMLYVRILGAEAALPLIDVVSPFGHFSRRGFDPSLVVNLEVPAGQPIRFNWTATAGPGRAITGYRWALDLPDVPDAVRPGNPLPGRWSRWDLATGATIGPFAGSETHTLYIEARDNSSCRSDEAGVSLVTLQLSVIQPDFSRELLIVDDTRYLLDRVNLGTTCDNSSNRPIGLWPTAAELDTFLYARGGVPWRCYPPVNGQPQLSTPGIFNGYRFDTVGTNIGIANLTVPFSTLSRYRHVLWITDASAALRTGSGIELHNAQTSMRYMNSIQTVNTLAAYVAWGGRVWLAGGGAATASLINFNRTFNDNTLPVPRTLTFRHTDNELVPGRFVYDQAHWRSELKQFRINNGRIMRYLGRFEGSPGTYASLPAEIQLKTPATDPFPPNRTGQGQSVFYQTQTDIEFLSAANEILEDQDSGPDEDFQPTLDSLYKARASTLQPDSGPDAVHSVVMTWYHGQDNPPFVMTGFNLWNFRRQHCAQLVDFVLQQLWGLTREAPVQGPIEVVDRRIQFPGGKLAQPRETSASALEEARRQ